MHFIKDFYLVLEEKELKQFCWTLFYCNFFLFCTLQSGSMHLERKKVKLEQVEVHEYPRPAPLFNLSK